MSTDTPADRLAATPAAQAAADLVRLAAATRRLLDTCENLDADALAVPSRLPGWSRAHVMTHLARNADAMRVLLLSARTGRPLPQYPSRELRDADIDVGARRPAELVMLDLRASSERFAVDAESLDPRAWAGSVTVPSMSVPLSAADLPGHRLREVEAHHADLGAGYELSDTPSDVMVSFLDQLPHRFAGSTLDPAVLVAADLGRRWEIGAGRGPRIEGTAAGLLSWALGRTGPDGLVSDQGSVPASPGWR
jgi:maleylpyruvate isomerase